MAGQKATFIINRFDETEGRTWEETYTIPVNQGMTVLEALWYIVRHVDGSLAFRYSCRGAVCGSCAMVINETITLACHTQVLDLGEKPVRIAPLPRMKRIKDLVVDLEPFLKKYRSIDPYLVHDEKHEREITQSPEARRLIFDSVKCILCTSCHAACPLTAVDEDYLGPAVLTAAQRFAFDGRNEQRDGMLQKTNRVEGAFGCHTISRCTAVCPKDIGPSHRIKELKGEIRVRSGNDNLSPEKE
jgi:succinate dehydrogenase / fumarate reductase iron-sulfur subunit